MPFLGQIFNLASVKMMRLRFRYIPLGLVLMLFQILPIQALPYKPHTSSDRRLGNYIFFKETKSASTATPLQFNATSVLVSPE